MKQQTQQQTKQSQPSNSLDSNFFENVIALNAFSNQTYLSAIIDHCDLTFFKNPDVRVFLKEIKEFFLEHEVIPNKTELRARFNDDTKRDSLKTVLESFKTLDKKYLDDELYKNTETFFKERAIYNNILRVADAYSGDNNELDTGDVLELFEGACNISLFDDLGRDYFDDIDIHCRELSTPDQFIPTKWSWVDKMLGGGLIKSDIGLYVFSGTTNVGKSIVLGNLGVNLLKQGLTVVLISLEMSEKIYTKRISSNLTQIPFAELNTQTLSLKQMVQDFHRANPSARLIVKEFPTKGINAINISAYIKKLMQKKGLNPDVIIVDYLNLLNPTNITGSLYDDVKAVTEQVRRLCYTFKGTPIVSATQLNRDAYNMSNPGLETQSESAGLSHTVDAQFSLWAEEHEKDLGIIHMGLMKSRFGRNFGATTFRINYDTLTISEIDNEDVFTTESELNDISATLDKM